MHYSYTLAGTGGDGTVWELSGRIAANNILDAVAMAMRETFIRLTAGRAVYGQPGVGCVGPYTITRIVLDHQETLQ